MTAFLNTTDPNNRLIEALGSAALFSDSSSVSSPLGLPLSTLALGGGTDTSVDGDQANTNGQSSTPLNIAPLLGTTGGEAEMTDALPLLGAGSLSILGETGIAQPIINPANKFVQDFHEELIDLGAQTGTYELVKSVATLGGTVGPGNIGFVDGNGPYPTDGHTNLVTDVVNAPTDLLNGGQLGTSLDHIGADLSDIVHRTTDVLDALLNGGDPTNPLPELISSLGTDIKSVPILNLANGDGLLSGLVGDLTHSSSGHLIDVDLGPQQSNGLVLDLLSAPSSDGHTASVNAVDVGPSGPHLADLGLLTGSSNSDGLVGNLLGGDHGLLGGVTSGGAAAAPVAVVTQVVDIVPAVGGLDHGLLDLHAAHII